MRKILIFTVVSVLLTNTSCNGQSSRNRENPPAKNPTTVTSVPKPLPKPVVNVYIENSGSMDGYIRGGTEFKDAVFGYLSDIKVSDIVDTINLCYVNEIITKQVSVVDANSDILMSFAQKLNPSNFKNGGGNFSTSDISDVIKSVLSKTTDKSVTILVTDGIFSPGKQRADNYFSIQQSGIKVSMAQHLKKYLTTAVIVYQLQSKFNGTYFNNVDAKIPINENRPFYIWVIGDVEQLCNIRKNIEDDKLKERSAGQILNIFTAMNGNQAIRFAVKPGSGKFESSRKNPKTDIKNLKKDSRAGKVKFAVNVDFSQLLLDESYLTNPANYENSSKYALEIKPSTTKGYTHTLFFTSDKVTKETVSIKLKANLPKWIETSNDDSGVSAVKNKTYGIKYQLGGVYDAFTFTNKYYTEIKININ
jgi:hypothetical protein